ncbi:MAG TPA: exopolysaccharide biosynthesis polyprenyl glycosylphosphotransferase, partial [Ignavibacteriaceae bacterium]|nr:exopolysaccharide biosynthesis polyprenyl glycosylphosphotransferase [Ignavibacteriaceae bacterium]
MIVQGKSHYYLRLFLDLVLLNAAFIIAASASQSFSILIQRNYMFILLAVLNFLWYFVANVINFYEDFHTSIFSFQTVSVFKIILVQVLTAVLFIFFVKEALFTRNFIIFYTFLLLIFVSARVVIVRTVLIRVNTREKNLWNLLIIGAGEIGSGFYEMMEQHKEFGYNFVGFLDDSENNMVIGRIADLEKVIVEKKVDEVVIALPFYASGLLDEIINICNVQAVRVNIIPDYFRFVSKKFQVNMLGDFPIIRVRSEPLAEAHWKVIKRLFDILFSVIVLVFILSWLIPVVYILDKIFSKGPALFKQDRIGTENKIFKCYKFRTMHTDLAEEKYQPLTKNDPRITPIGGFLRKSNLDELPQFINVLKGEMSVVGPRPHPIPYHEVYQQIVSEIKIRSWVKPGITGWAQIHGLRGDVEDFEVNRK